MGPASTASDSRAGIEEAIDQVARTEAQIESTEQFTRVFGEASASWEEKCED